MTEEKPAELVEVDPIAEMQKVVAQFDPDAMPLNIITIVEWLEPDGSYSMSTIHTPMPVWHMRGMLGWAEDIAQIPLVVVNSGPCEDDNCPCQDDEECED